MSSFVSVTPKSELSLGNPTFKLLLRELDAFKDKDSSVDLIVRRNPIADCVGGLMLIDMAVEDLYRFFDLICSLQTLIEAGGRPHCTEAGFDILTDLNRFKKEFRSQLELMAQD